MHPVILQQLAAERIREMIADADDARQARQARVHAELQPASPDTAIAALPAACRSGRSADGDQGQPDELAFQPASSTEVAVP